MSVYSFSTQDTKRPADTKAMDDVKAMCVKKNLNFSGLCVNLLKEWLECEKNTKR